MEISTALQLEPSLGEYTLKNGQTLCGWGSANDVQLCDFTCLLPISVVALQLGKCN